MKLLALIIRAGMVAQLLVACITEPEKRVRVIDCGDLDFEEDPYDGPQPQVFHVTDSTCTRIPQ